MLISNPCKKYECRICHQKYSRIEEIRAHVKTTHLVHITCSLCDKLFPNKDKLLAHKKLHFQVELDSLSTAQQSNGIIQASEGKNNETEGEQSSCLIGANLDSLTPENSIEVLSKSPPSCHINDTESATSEVELSNNQGRPCDIVSSRACSSPEEKTLQYSVVVEHLPQQGVDESIECLAKNNSKGDEGISLSSSICVQLEDDWGVTSVGATSTISETGANEVKCVDEDNLSVTIDKDTYFIIPFKETTYFIDSLKKNLDCVKKCSQKPKELKNLDYVKKCSPKPKELKNLDCVKKCPQSPTVYNCSVCENTYDNIESVQSHIKMAHVNFLTCLLCNEKFSTRSEYLSHSNAHLNNSWAEPEEIGEPCPNGNLGKEASGEVGKGKEPSGEVGNAMASKAEVTSMRKSKSFKPRKEKEYKCRLCQKKYKCVEDVRTHIKKSHLTDLICKLCNQEFDSKYSLIDHAKVHFGNSPKSMPVDSDGTCPETLPIKGSKGNFVSSEGKSRDCNDGDISVTGKINESFSVGEINEVCHKCEECSLLFDHASALISHQKTHKKVLYKCGVCDFSSSLKKSVIVHLNQEKHSFRGEFNEDE
ncbi:PR domain zinc finger protein 5-like [Hetaerina americana]|uniref:PR domain zinc finger protein 5-like n=1 Tax=Hetaerina americana TaxID=62018 RepID=UPI003A7F5DBA